MGTGGCFAALAFSVLAVGGAPRWAQAGVAAIVVIALGSAALSRRVFNRAPALVVLLGLATALTAIQLVPLPEALLGLVDGMGTALRDDGVELVGGSSWHVLSRDPANTLRALIFFLTLLGVAMIALRVSATERGRYKIVAGVAGLAAFTTLIVGVHALFGMHALYGIYVPQHADPPLLGPLLNGNHLGCFTAMGTVLAAGLVWYPRQPAKIRVLWLVVVAACGATTLAGWSRGATLALASGGLVVAITFLAQRFLVVSDLTHRTRRTSFVTSSLPISIVAACVVALILYASAGGVTAQLSQTSFSEIDQPRSKFAAWRSSTRLIDEAPWTGVGRGAFESSFTRVHPPSAFSTFSHAENEYVQAVVDWGVPGAVLLALATIWFLIAAFRRWRDGALVAAAFGGIGVVMLQSNVDFGIELLGLAAPVTAIAATLSYVSLRETSHLAWVRAIRLLHIAALIVGGILLLSPMTKSLDEDHQALAGRRVSLDDARAIVSRHPMDYFVYATYAAQLSRAHDPSAIAFLNHALVLHPTLPGLHRIAAHLLAETGHAEQSALEYAAVLRGTLDRRSTVEEVIAKLPKELVPLAIPTDDDRIDEMFRILTEQRASDVAGAWLQRVLERRPDNLIACERLYDVAARQAEMSLASYAQVHCHGFEPTRRARIDLAHALLAKHGDKEVLALLANVETWTGRSDEKAEGWLALCDGYIDLGQVDSAKHCLRRLDASGLVPPDHTHEISGRLETLSAAPVAP